MNIYDIADKAGVSIATVSRVLNGSGPVSEKTRAKVNSVMEELGYTPNVFARGLMLDSMKLIGVLTSDVRDLYYASAIHTIEVEARERGFDILLCSTGNDLEEKKKYMGLLLQKRVDGIILVGSVFKEKNDNSHIVQAAQSVPVIIINGLIEGKNLYSVLCDDTLAVYDTVKLLRSEGREDIAYVYDVQTMSGIRKIAGYKKALQESGSAVRESLLIKTSSGIQGGYEAVDRLIAGGARFSAVVTSEDLLAAGVLKRLQELGKTVPSEVAVTGFNNSVISRCTSPELTTVDNKVDCLSSMAVKILLDVLEGKNMPSATILQPEIIIRRSSSIHPSEPDAPAPI